MDIALSRCLCWECEIWQSTLQDSTRTHWRSWAQRLLHQRSSYANTSLARDGFRALTFASSRVLGQELGRCVKLILAKAASEALAWAGEGSARQQSQRGPYSAQPETTEEPPGPCTAPHETMLLCRCDFPPGSPPSPFSLLCALLPPKLLWSSTFLSSQSFPFSSPGLCFHSLLRFLCSNDQQQNN